MLFGLLIIAQPGVATLIWTLGLFALLVGIILIVFGFKVGRVCMSPVLGGLHQPLLQTGGVGDVIRPPYGRGKEMNIKLRAIVGGKRHSP